CLAYSSCASHTRAGTLPLSLITPAPHSPKKCAWSSAFQAALLLDMLAGDASVTDSTPCVVDVAALSAEKTVTECFAASSGLITPASTSSSESEPRPKGPDRT